MAVQTSLGINLWSSWNGKGVQNARNDISSVGAVTRSIASTIGVAMGAASAAVGAWGVAAAKAGFQANSQMQLARTGLTNMLGSAEKAEAQLKKLSDFASESPFSKTIFVQAQQQLIGYGVEAQKVIPILDAIQNTVLAGGGTEQNLVRVTEVLARMRSAGQVTIGDFNELGTEGVNAAKIVASEFGTTEAKIRERVSSGKLSVEDFYTAFTEGSDKAFGNMSESARTTSVGMVDRLKGVQRRIGEIFATPFIDPKGGGLLVELGNTAADALNKVEDAAAPLAATMSTKLSPAFDRIGAVIAAAGDRITTSGIQSFFSKAVEFAPIIGGAVAAMAAAFSNSIPILGSFGLTMNPVAAALLAVVTLSPELRGAFGKILQTLAPLVDPLKDLAGILIGVLAQSLVIVAGLITSAVVPVFKALVPVVAFLARVVGVVIVTAFNLLAPAIQGVVSVIAGIVNWFRQGSAAARILGAVILGVLAAITAHFVPMMARLALWGILWVANWVLMSTQSMIHAVRIAAAWLIAMGPIGLIIGIVTAVVALIIANWGKIKAFTIMVWTAIVNWVVGAWQKLVSVVTTVFTAIKNFFIGAWTAIWNFIGPTVMRIVALVVNAFNAAKASLTAALRIIGNVFRLAWTGMKNFFVMIWNAIWSFIGPIIKKIVGFISEQWNRMKLGFQVIMFAMQVVWRWFKTNVLDRIIAVVRTVVAFVKARWEQMKLSFKIMADGIKAIWNWFKTNVIDRLTNAIKSGVDKIKGFWQGMKDKAASIFNAVKDKIEWFRDKFKAVRDKIGSFVDKIKDKWEGLKDATETVFEKIQDFVKTPVKFIIDTIYNDGIVKFWNKISDKLFGGDAKLKEVSTDDFARGGPVRGPGSWTSDSINARLSNGEHVWTAREVAAAGGHGRVMALRSAVMGGRNVSAGPNGNQGHQRHTPGLFMGGFLDDFFKAQEDVPDIVAQQGDNEFLSKVNGFIVDLNEMVPDIGGWMKGLKFDEKVAIFGDMMKKGVKRGLDALVDMIEGLIGIGGAGANGGPGDYKAMGEWIKSVVPGTQITSGLRHGSGTSYHNSGKAIDMAFADGTERTGGGDAEKAYNIIKSTWMQSILELIWDFSPDGPSFGIKNGKPHVYTGPSAGPGTHADHIHWANEGGGHTGGWGGAFSAGGVEQWVGIASRVLSDIGAYSSYNLASVLECIRQESSGRPDLQNNWDINAKNGIPSKGLMQVIDPTYNAFKPKNRSGDIWTPYNNIYAAVKYAMNRYGAGWQEAITAPGGYSVGGAVKPLSYDNGGLLPPGVNLVHNGTRKPEPVGHDLVGRGDTIIINVDGSVLTTDRQLQDVMVAALSEAKRKGRI